MPWWSQEFYYVITNFGTQITVHQYQTYEAAKAHADSSSNAAMASKTDSYVKQAIDAVKSGNGTWPYTIQI